MTARYALFIVVRVTRNDTTHTEHTMTATTTAHLIADLLNNDGQCWTAEDGRTFSDLVQQHDADHDTDGFDKCRYIFPDGSILTVCGEAWDLGFPDCFCWAGSPNDDCDCSHD